MNKTSEKTTALVTKWDAEIEKLKQYDKEKIVIKNNQDYNSCETLLQGLTALRDNIKAETDPVIKAAHNAHKQAIAMRDKYLKPVQQVIDKIKSAMGNYVLEQKQKEEALKREKERIEQEGLPTPPTPVLTPLQTSTQTVEYWDFEIIDEMKIPREYLMPNEMKIRKTIQNFKGMIEIPGVKNIKKIIVKNMRQEE